MTTSMKLTAALVVFLAMAQSRPSEAAEMVTTPELRQAAITACTGDVLRLCPTVVFDEQQVFACMRVNRDRLAPGCRSVFDKGAKTVRQ